MWLGHVAVRKIEYISEKLWIPIVITLIIGLCVEVWSLLTDLLLLSTATGILGVTLLWDSFEFWRQQKRIIKGHAPANPDKIAAFHVMPTARQAAVRGAAAKII